MKNKLGRLGLSGLALAALVGCANVESTLGQIDFHPEYNGFVEGMPVKISHNNDESWRIIRIDYPDGFSVEAEDYATDDDGKFNVYKISNSDGKVITSMRLDLLSKMREEDREKFSVPGAMGDSADEVFNNIYNRIKKSGQKV